MWRHTVEMEELLAVRLQTRQSLQEVMTGSSVAGKSTITALPCVPSDFTPHELRRPHSQLSSHISCLKRQSRLAGLYCNVQRLPPPQPHRPPPRPRFRDERHETWIYFKLFETQKQKERGKDVLFRCCTVLA